MKTNLYASVFKRVLDIASALTLGVVASPVILGAAAAVKASSKGPILFRQTRLTKDEKEFQIYKFRTMYTEAPSLPPYMLKDPNAFITPVGKWLRKTSIDELPQIINVLKGEMSFVGPRPGAARNEEDLRIERRKRGVFSVRPGITGWAQVNGRDELAANPAEKAEYDAFYAKNISLTMDLRCLLSTVTTVVTGEGYYEGSKPDAPRRKVLFLIHTLGGGGAEKIMVDMVKKLSPERYDVTVMTVLDTGIHRDRLPEHVTYRTMIKLPSFLRSRSTDTAGTLNAGASRKTKLAAWIYPKLWWFAPTKIIHRVNIRSKYDVEVAFLEGISAKIIASSPNSSARKLAWVHTDFSQNHKSKQFFRSRSSELRCYGSFDDVVFVSPEAKAGFEAAVGNPVDSIVLRNIIDVEEVIAASSELTENSAVEMESNSGTTDFRSKPFSICVVGRLTSVKAVDRLIDISRDLQNDGQKVELHIVGDGQERTALEMRARGMTGVYFHGFQQNPYPYIKQADLFVIPSHAEGFSTVMMEALILDVPVLSTRVSGSSFLAPEMVTDNSAEALKAAIEAVIVNDDNYRLIKEKSQQIKQKVIETNAQTWEQIENLLNKKPANRGN